MRRLLSFFVVGTVLLGPGRDVLAIATADNTISASNPTNYGYSINWDYVYKFRNSSSVAIDHYWILTAAHVADDGASGNLTINGEIYTPQETIYHPTADLALVRFDKPFPGYYPLYDGEIYSVTGHGPNQELIFDELLLAGFGRTGTVTAVTFENGPLGNGTKRWGTNKGTGEQTVNVNVGGTAGNRSTLCFTTAFTLLDTPYEAGAAQYDSGGPVFINSGGDWNVAGISLYLTGTNPYYTGNAMGKVAEYRAWITNNIPNYDADMDGLPDWWESRYSSDSTSMVATNDLDGDGFTNYQEWIADTVPTNGASYFEMNLYTNGTSLVFTSSTNREYQIDYRLNLASTNESWQSEVAWFAGSVSQTVETVTAPISNRFYRIQIRLP